MYIKYICTRKGVVLSLTLISPVLRSRRLMDHCCYSFFFRRLRRRCQSRLRSWTWSGTHWRGPGRRCPCPSAPTSPATSRQRSRPPQQRPKHSHPQQVYLLLKKPFVVFVSILRSSQVVVFDNGALFGTWQGIPTCKHRLKSCQHWSHWCKELLCWLFSSLMAFQNQNQLITSPGSNTTQWRQCFWCFLLHPSMYLGFIHSLFEALAFNEGLS